MLNDILQQHGLSKPESKAYLATLELGNSPVSKIARKMGEGREATYYILETLEKKGFIKSVVLNKIKNYFAISPEELLDIQKGKMRQLMGVMPELMALWNGAENKPKVSLFEGVEGLKFLYQDTIKKEKSEIKAFLGHTNTDKYLQKYLNSIHLKDRVKNEVNAKILMPVSMKEDKGYEPNDNKTKPKKFTEIKYVSDIDFTMNNEIDIYGDNKVGIMLYGTNEMFGLLIQNKSIHDMLTALFDLLRKDGDNVKTED